MPEELIRDVDRRVWNDELAPWLPERILDFHVHVSLPEHSGDISPERMAANWAMEVGVAQPWEELRETYDALFPDRAVGCLAFGAVHREALIEQNNAYVLSGARTDASRASALLCSRPEWPADVIEAQLALGYAGLKPYPDLVPGGDGEVSVFDFLPNGHLQVLDAAGGILMLHLPRAGRIGDADNVREVREIRQRFPGIRLVIAHIGRAYCLPTAQRGLPALASDPGIFFDTSANLNADVFRYALETVGPDRLLFGSDLPITRMRGVREHVGERYINFTSYPYSWNTNRKGPDEEARYTFFLYEELGALVRAIREAGFGKREVNAIMHANGQALLDAHASAIVEEGHHV